MHTLKEYRTWNQDLDVHGAPTETERAQRAERRRLLELSTSTDTYRVPIAETFAELDQIPGAYEEPTEISEDLAEAERDHDGWAGLFYETTKAQQRHPKLTAEQKAAIRAAAQAIVPALGDLTKPYAVEAQNARDREAALAVHGAVLATVPIVGGTCLDAAEHYIAAGKRIGDGLARRALSEATGITDRTRVRELRNRLLHLVTRWRQAVQDEIILRKRLPTTAEALIFGYLDAIDRK